MQLAAKAVSATPFAANAAGQGRIVCAVSANAVRLACTGRYHAPTQLSGQTCAGSHLFWRGLAQSPPSAHPCPGGGGGKALTFLASVAAFPLRPRGSRPPSPQRGVAPKRPLNAARLLLPPLPGSRDVGTTFRGVWSPSATLQETTPPYTPPPPLLLCPPGAAHTPCSLRQKRCRPRPLRLTPQGKAALFVRCRLTPSA